MLKNDELYEELLFNFYYLQNPNEILRSGYGICYDQVEFARRWFVNNHYLVKTYFSLYHNHAFLVYQDDDRYCLFERTLPKYNGIYSFGTIDQLLQFYKSLQVFIKGNLPISDIEIIEYVDPPFGVGFFEFISYVEESKFKEKLYKI